MPLGRAGGRLRWGAAAGEAEEGALAAGLLRPPVSATGTATPGRCRSRARRRRCRPTASARLTSAARSGLDPDRTASRPRRRSVSPCRPRTARVRTAVAAWSSGCATRTRTTLSPTRSWSIGPSRTSRPAAMIPTTSARCWTSPRMWLDMKTVLPVEARWRRVARIATIPAGSRPLAGSSSSSRRGSLSSAAAIPSRCFMPERVGLDLVARAIAQAHQLEQLLDPSVRRQRRRSPRAPGGSPGRTGRGRTMAIRSSAPTSKRRRRSPPTERPPQDLDRCRRRGGSGR